MKGITLLLITAAALAHANPARFFENGCPKDTSKLLPHQDCGRFFVCFKEIKFVRECPYGLHFNAELELCDLPRNAKCNLNRLEHHSDSGTHLRNGRNENPAVICSSENSEGVLFPHEKCNQFYKCSGRHPVAFDCPTNLLFNEISKMCDWPEKVDCDNRLIADDTDGGNNDNENYAPDVGVGVDKHDPNQAPVICATENSDGVLVAHENCDRFYKCFDGHPVALNCPDNLLYNPEMEYCDWPWNVNCGERAISDDKEVVDNNGGINQEGVGNVGNNADPSEAPKICAAENSDGVLVAHENCDRFYKCFDGHPVALNCPDNLLYSPEMEYCDWPWNVNCGERTISDDKEVVDNNGGNNQEGVGNVGNNADPSEAPKICAAENSDGVLVAHENCDRFYKCFDGHPVALNCPDNLLYSPEMEYCDWPWKVNCGERTISDDKEVIDNNGGNNQEGGGNVGNNANPSEAPKICATENSDGVLVAHENCDRFYKCFDGHPVALNCPDNLLYNPEMDYCDWPWNVNCGERTISDDKEVVDNNGGNNQEEGGNVGNNADPSEAPKICAAENSDGVLVAHENCDQFYKCFEGKPVAMNCPVNLFYNPEQGYCDWQFNVKCNNKVIPTQNNDGNGNNFVNQLCSSNDDDIIPHENCNQFYKCVHSHMEPMSCPPGLYFNTIIKVCDWPMNVDCTQRKK